MVALNHIYQLRELLTKDAIQLVVIDQGEDVGQLPAWETSGGESSDYSTPILNHKPRPHPAPSLRTDLRELGEGERHTDEGLPVGSGSGRPGVRTRGCRWWEVRHAVDQPEAPIFVQEQDT